MKLLILALGFFCSFAFAQETVESIKKQIRAVEEETKRENALHEAEKKRHADFIAAGREKVVSLNNQMKAVRAEIDSMKAEIGRLAEARNKAASTAHWYEGKKTKYQNDLAKFLETLVPMLDADFPYRSDEAVQSLKEVAEQLKKGVINSDDALGRALELFSERIRLGYTTETWKGVLTYENRQISGSFLRYGAVSMVFVSTDGNDVLWLARTEDGYSWQNVSGDMEMRALLKEAMKVAEGKTAPKLVLLPISLYTAPVVESKAPAAKPAAKAAPKKAAKPVTPAAKEAE